MGVKEFKSKAEAIKALDKKFKSKSGVSFADRAQAGDAGTGKSAGGKYHTLAEQRAAAAGGRMADSKTICFCLAWDKMGVDLDIHCNNADGTTTYFCDKNPNGYCELDVDKRGGHYPNQVENIFLTAAAAADGDYNFFVRYYSGPDDGGLPFTFTFNQFGKDIHEGKGHSSQQERDTPCVTLTMKKGKVSKVAYGKKVRVTKVKI